MRPLSRRERLLAVLACLLVTTVFIRLGLHVDRRAREATALQQEIGALQTRVAEGRRVRNASVKGPPLSVSEAIRLLAEGGVSTTLTDRGMAVSCGGSGGEAWTALSLLARVTELSLTSLSLTRSAEAVELTMVMEASGGR